MVIPKSVTPSRIEENMDVFGFDLSQEEIDMITSFDCNGRIVVPMTDGKPRDAGHPNYPFNDEF